MTILLSSPLLEAIFRTVETLPGSSIENVAAVLEAETLLSAGLRARLLQSLALPHERVVLAALLGAWSREVPLPHPALVAAGLRSASYTGAAMDREQSLELVWTGPSPGRIFRRTDQALLQVIRAAKNDLLLVTFAAYKVPLLIDALRLAIERGVTVRFVAESAESSGGKVGFNAATALQDLAQNIEFYVWPRAKREKDAAGNYGSLHAKCALADEELLLISSANLTEHALALNMEMGLLVCRGKLVRTVRKHFDRLIQESILKRV